MSFTYVVLNQDIKKLGYKGEIVRVRRGFARNYLVRQGFADYATKSRRIVAESRKEQLVMRKQQIFDNLKAVLEKLKGLKVVFKSKLTDKGKLYGSISEEDVIKAIEKEAKVKLEKEFVKVPHIKEAGEHYAVIRLGEGFEEKITIVVEADKKVAKAKKVVKKIAKKSSKKV